MTYARRMRAARVASTSPVGQAEYYAPGVYDVTVPADVTEIDVAGCAAGENAVGRPEVSWFPAGYGGNLHWRNKIPVTPGETLTLTVPAAGLAGSNLTASLKRGSTLLIDARGGGQPTQHGALGGGGGKGGQGGAGSGGDGGLGGGAGGYAGTGGRGGTWTYTNGTFPEADSGGGRGGDRDGVPTGWSNMYGEGVGLLGRTLDKQSSLGPRKVGGGGTAEGGAIDGGLRIMFGGDRSYPDNAADRATDATASYVAGNSGSGTLPQAISFHASAQPGDLVLITVTPTGNGTLGDISGSSNWNRVGPVGRWKQITQADIDASTAGTVILGGTVPCTWGVVVYRGGMVVRFRAIGSGDATVTIPGVTKRVDCKRMVTFASDRDVTTIPNPTGFTSRVNRTGTGAFRISDKAAADYNGEPIVYGGMGGEWSPVAALFEIY